MKQPPPNVVSEPIIDVIEPMFDETAEDAENSLFGDTVGEILASPTGTPDNAAAAIRLKIARYFGTKKNCCQKLRLLFAKNYDSEPLFLNRHTIEEYIDN